MQFERLESQLQTCEQHLDATGARSTEIEYYLVQFLLTRICAEYETRIKVLFERRCSRSTDAHMRAFAKRSAKEACKHFAISDIKGVLGFFGDDYKDDFDDQVMNTTAHTAWNNIYFNRQAVAHRAGAVMSFTDLKKNYQESLAVLDALVAVLGLRPRETRGLK